jgi:hypothetical protein
MVAGPAQGNLLLAVSFELVGEEKYTNCQVRTRQCILMTSSNDPA